jgi:hypothetical protein
LIKPGYPISCGLISNQTPAISKLKKHHKDTKGHSKKGDKNSLCSLCLCGSLFYPLSIDSVFISNPIKPEILRGLPAFPPLKRRSVRQRSAALHLAVDPRTFPGLKEQDLWRFDNRRLLCQPPEHSKLYRLTHETEFRVGKCGTHKRGPISSLHQATLRAWRSPSQSKRCGHTQTLQAVASGYLFRLALPIPWTAQPISGNFLPPKIPASGLDEQFPRHPPA